ncbi:MAG: xylulokinase [Candidatus Bipolaricaulota bacterium]|nr:xylulokinase [Candidatus Bipolaricaulota bacterium]
MSNSDYLLGLDLGTTRVKVLLVSPDGNVVASADDDYPLDRPADEAAEQSPEEWWKASCKVIRSILARPDIEPEQIAGLGLAGQMHTAVFLDENLQPVRPAITWADGRSSSQAEKIERRIGEKNLLEITYNRSLPGFTAPKVLWLKENEPELFAKVKKVVLPKDYLRYRLTGELIADKADASATLLFNLAEEEWSDRMLKLVGLTTDSVPPLVESSSVAGEITKKAAELTGLAEGTPVVAGAGDQQAGALGVGAVKPGIVVSTIGTGGQLFTTSEELIEPREGRVHVFRQCLPQSWHVMGAMQAAGLALRWFKENVVDKAGGGRFNYEDISDLASKAPVGSNDLLFLPYLTGERSPHLDPDARGCFIGLSLNHELPHLLRGIMEGVTFGMRDSMEVLQELGLPIEEIRCAGGGSKSQVWRKIQSDVYNRAIAKTNIEEPAALGAALLAGIGLDLFASEPGETVAQFLDLSQKVTPTPSHVEVYDRLHERYQSLYRVLRPEFKELAAL